MVCFVIMLMVVVVLFVKSVFELEGIYFVYGKICNKDKVYFCFVILIISIVYVGVVGYVN